MRHHLRVVILEEAAADAELVVAELQMAGYECEWRRVDDEPSFVAALAGDVDLILADYTVPLYSAVRALSELKQRALDIPFIVITEAEGEEKAVDCLRLGATDYLLKDRLARLPSAVARALDDRRMREEVRNTHAALLESDARFLRLASDITDRESLEDQLRQSQKMEAIGRLAGGIAHDFNNLLTAILGYGELMLDRLPANSDLRPDIAEIIKAGERAGALTRQLLAFSRKQVLQPQRLNLNTVVTDFEKMLGRVIGEDVRLLTRLAPGVGVVHADRGQIEQVLMNMVVNARDAMPRGGTLSIETHAAAFDEPFSDRQARLEPGRWVRLTVSDTGCGMPADVAARVFEPFFTTKGPAKGTGLGLSTVYGIVAQSGGQIALESAPGMGTTFRVYLPEVSRTPSDELESEHAADRFGGTETILLVEDEFGIRKLIRRALERQGYTVLEAATGQQAVAMAKRHTGPIDLLLSDIVMPGMSGVDVAQHIVAERPQLKVMHMSGFAVAAHVGRLSPNVSFLQKPFTVDALSRQVRQCLDNATGGGVARA